MFGVCVLWTAGACGGSGGDDGTGDGFDAVETGTGDLTDVADDGIGDTSDFSDEPALEDVVFDIPEDVTGEVPPMPAFWVEIGLSFPKAYVFKGLWGASSKAMVVVGAGPLAYGYDGTQFIDLTPAAPPPILNSVWGSSPEDLWMVGMNGGMLHYEGGWGGEKCTTDYECGSSDPCAQGQCDGGECVLVPAPKPGCCGHPSLDTGFDEGNLAGFEVADTYESVPDKGGIIWNVVSHVDVATGQPRYTSEAWSLYFGIWDQPCSFDPDQHCPFFENGQIVGATATSPSMTIPAAQSATLDFQVFIDSESSSSYDKLTVKVVKAGGAAVTIWEKAEVGGSTGYQFVPATADLSEFMGQTVKIQFHFDSVDSQINNGEGVYVDDVTVTTVCGDVAQPTSFPTLFGVSGTAPDNVFAVGGSGAIVHYDGKSWTPMGVWGLAALYGLCSDPESGLWAVGNGGTVIRMVDGVFVQVPSGTDANLLACEPGMLAVGTGGAALKGDATGVQSLGQVAFQDLEGLTSLPDGHQYAVGADGTVVEFFEGKTTTLIVGDGVDLHAVYAAAPKAIWAVGEAGTVVRYNGVVWVSENTLAAQPLLGVHGAPSGKIMAVGGAGVAVTRIDGEWIVKDTGAGVDLYAVHYLSEDEAWLVGADGAIVHVEGDTFTPLEESPTNRHLYALALGPDGRLYASGLGVILALEGDEWRNVFASSDVDMRAVFALDEQNVFAVGKSGTILRYDGKNWAREPIDEIPTGEGDSVPFTSGIFGVWASALDDLWAVSEAGTWLHSDGGSWTAYQSGEEVTLRSVHGLSEKDVWMVGGNGTVIHWDGTGALKEEIAHPVATLYSVFATPDGEVFAVGDTGTILQRVAPQPTEAD